MSLTFFLRKNYRVVSYDLQGHGLSTGKEPEILDFGGYKDIEAGIKIMWKKIRLSKCSYCPQYWGSDLYRFLQERAKFEKVIYLAPLVRPTNWYFILGASKIIPYFMENLKRKFKKILEMTII
ncbi:hypothetical protein KHA80_20965 [Anaerobacillus sp. HL2]|nr:hypothetical protein KHA80_20965 [Anaerobacillus sp. HL2]